MRYSPVLHHPTMALITLSSDTGPADENSGRILAATSATGQVSHHGHGLLMPVLDHERAATDGSYAKTMWRMETTVVPGCPLRRGHTPGGVECPSQGG